MIKAVRGTRDLLPPETALWNFVEAAVRDVFRVAGTRDCHPERSKAVSEASRIAESKDLWRVMPHGMHRGFLTAPQVAPGFVERIP